MFQPTRIPFVDVAPATLSLYFYYADGTARKMGAVSTARAHEIASRAFLREKRAGADVQMWRAFWPGAGLFAYGHE